MSLPRRALARLSEFTLLGQIVDGLGIFPQFNEVFFGPSLLGNVVLFLATSVVVDLLHVVTRPDLMGPPCVENEPELPLEEEK